jgi:hypothetical protein
MVEEEQQAVSDASPAPDSTPVPAVEQKERGGRRQRSADGSPDAPAGAASISIHPAAGSIAAF